MNRWFKIYPLGARKGPHSFCTVAIHFIFVPLSALVPGRAFLTRQKGTKKRPKGLPLWEPRRAEVLLRKVRPLRGKSALTGGPVPPCAPLPSGGINLRNGVEQIVRPPGLPGPPNRRVGSTGGGICPSLRSGFPWASLYSLSVPTAWLPALRAESEIPPPAFGRPPPFRKGGGLPEAGGGISLSARRAGGQAVGSERL